MSFEKKAHDILVLLVDDHDLVRTGIRRILEDAPGIRVVGEAKNGVVALQMLRDLNPHVVLMDLKMPDADGIETTPKMIRVQPDVKIIILTAFDDDPFPARLMQAGALGFITKDAGAAEMILAIKAVYNGRRYMDPRVAEKLAFKHISHEENSPLEHLSERELQVLMLVARGLKVTDIGEKLCVSPKTINGYRYRLFAKLGVQSDVGLAHFAIRNGLLDANDATIVVPTPPPEDTSSAH